MGLTQTGTDGIKDDAITLAKQAAGTDGQIITYDASGNPVAVGPGTDGQVLTSTGAGSPPAFETIPASPITALNNATANELVTVGSTTTELDAEANLTFDTNLSVSGSDTSTSANAGGTGIGIKNTNNTNNNQNFLAFYDSSGTSSAAIVGQHENHSSTTGNLQFGTRNAGSYNEAMRIDSSGVVRIGGTDTYNASDKLTLVGSGNTSLTIDSTSSTESSIFFADGATGNEAYRGYLQYQNANDCFLIGTSATQRLRVDSDGIKFGSDTAAVNALNDYERGTWTPIDGSGHSLSISVQSASYVKVGDLVLVNLYINYPTTTNTANARINGLPFTSKAGNYHYLAGKGNGFTSAIGQIEQGSTVFYVMDGTTFLTNANVSQDYVLLSGCYSVA